MKYIHKQQLFSICFLLMASSMVWAQEIIRDTVKPKKTTETRRMKIDGVIATVGDYNILDSDIDKTFLELSSQGNSIKDITRCQMLGKLLEDKLYAHQAIQDSIVVSDDEIKSKMDEQLNYMIEQLGSMDKVVQYFKKTNEADFKAELSEIIKMNKLAGSMQKKIIDGVEITPEEVRTFFKKIPANELPVFGAEMEVSQIVVVPKVSESEKQKVINKLKEFKKEVQEGSSFSTKAVLYSQDPGSSSNGGFYRMNKKTPFVKEFKDVAFSLAEGEISEPFETDFGWHIIYIEKIKGQDLDLRHILLVPKTDEQALSEAKDRIQQIKKRIEDKSISFADAARAESDEKETKANGGVLINPKTQDTHFELTKMDPTLYGQVSGLKEGEVSIPQIDVDQSGKKKYKLLMVTNRIEEHTADYAKDYIKIKNLALKEKQINAIAKWSEEKIKETYVKINGEYRNCEFTNNWIKK
ncbi:peptidylprolyl isomerase [Flavobacterium sp. CYK-4]|uniref:peptidylprolyl isomerase n=1 Tax=Flavobacterium lotistagni TaxID=2709660 RepID=UPI0014080ABF|nr:peptidylprolyl isomerase [Flavobacterium lotistagni]NHM07344.1 peptidylprolyl isomerase [Flavobacterium lotistagni]